MKKNHVRMIFGFIMAALLMVGCENNLEMVLPQGPKGDKGDKGDPGKSAFELWLEHYDKDPNTTIEEFFNSLKGEDGEDGAVPVIGSNGNWFIDGVDTEIPARGTDGANGITPTVGDNGNWFIGEEDTGIPARGQDGADGVDGKSAYELWKEAVDAGEMTNKDGTEYTGGNTWEDFLIWLQGGDVSVLHVYWQTLPDNADKTIEEFIEELFSCHCDGIVVSVIAVDECVSLNPDGTVNEEYTAQLRITAAAGTEVVVTGDGINLSGNITDNTIPLVFNIARGDESIQLTIDCTLSSETETKSAVIPALRYVQLASAPTVEQVTGLEQDIVTLSFETPLTSLSVDGDVVYSDGAVVDGSGWVVSNGGRTFTRTFSRIQTVQSHTVQAVGADEICSTIDNAFTIPSLTPVEVGPLSLNILDDCTLALTFTGTPGMNVIAINSLDANDTLDIIETTPGSYALTSLPRNYDPYTFYVRAEMSGYGTVEDTVEVAGALLAPVAEPLTVAEIGGVIDGTNVSLIRRRFTNNTNGPLNVTIERSANTSSSSLEHPLMLETPFTGTLGANESADVDFYRDYTGTLAPGEYLLTFSTTTSCGIFKSYTLIVENLQQYRHTFTLPVNWNNGEGDPDELLTFGVSVLDGMPGGYVEFQLFNGTAYGGVTRTQLDANGNRAWNVTMTRAQIQAALDNEKGYFYFFSDAAYTSKFNIGAAKEEVTFIFE